MNAKCLARRVAELAPAVKDVRAEAYAGGKEGRVVGTKGGMMRCSHWDGRADRNR